MQLTDNQLVAFFYAIPLYILYEVSIFISAREEKRKLREAEIA